MVDLGPYGAGISDGSLAVRERIPSHQFGCGCRRCRHRRDDQAQHDHDAPLHAFPSVVDLRPLLSVEEVTRIPGVETQGMSRGAPKLRSTLLANPGRTSDAGPAGGSRNVEEGFRMRKNVVLLA